MDYRGEREHQAKASAKRIRVKGPGAYEDYKAEKNARSIDGRPAWADAPAGRAPAARDGGRAARARRRPARAGHPGRKAGPGAADALAELAERLQNTYPYPDPMYAGQMLKPPAPVAWAAYATAMLLNPNNHALDGGPATAELEREAVEQLRVMLGVPAPGLGHLTSSGTVANLEALWVARELTGGADRVSSADAHYTHARMCGVLGVEHEPVARTRAGGWTLKRWRQAARRRRRHRGGHRGHHLAGRAGRRRRDRGPVRRARRAHARGHRLRRLLRAAGRRRGARRGRGPLRRDRPRRLGGDRPAQARPPALRLRLRAVRRPRRRAGCTRTTRRTRTSPRRTCTWRDQPGVLARGRGGRRAVGHAARAAADARGPRRRAGRLPRRGAGAGGAAAPPTSAWSWWPSPSWTSSACALRARTPSAPSPRWPGTGWHVATLRTEQGTALRCCLLKPEHLGVVDELAEALAGALGAQSS